MPLPKTIEQKWQCPECKALSDTFYEGDCTCFCIEREVLVCVVCNKVFRSRDKRDAEKHATECFADELGNPLPPQAELESAGQERLFDR